MAKHPTQEAWGFGSSHAGTLAAGDAADAIETYAPFVAQSVSDITTRDLERTKVVHLITATGYSVYHYDPTNVDAEDGTNVIWDSEDRPFVRQSSPSGVAIDEAGLFEDLEDFDGEEAGFIYLAVDGDGDTITDPVLFAKLSSADADWSDPIEFVPADGQDGQDAGFKYTFSSGTSGDPGSGKFLLNNATFMSATALHISETDGDGGALATYLAAMDNGSGSNKALCIFRKQSSGDCFIFLITAALTDAGDYDTYPISPVAGVGTIANNNVCRGLIIPLEKGDPGTNGTNGDDLAIDHGPVADNTERDAYVGISVGETIGVTDSDGNGTSAIYRLLDDSPQTWSSPLYTSGGGGGGGSGLLKCRTVALVDIDITGELENGDTVNGVTLATGDVVLLTAQTDDEENGPYEVPASGAASRHSDYADFDAVAGSYFAVLEGTARADTLWLCTSDAGGTIDTDPLEFEQFMGNEDDWGLITGAVSGGDDYGSIA